MSRLLRLLTLLTVGLTSQVGLAQTFGSPQANLTSPSVMSFNGIALSTKLPDARQYTGYTVYTSDLGPVYSNGISWLPMGLSQSIPQGVLLDAYKSSGDADDTASLTRANAACVPILLGARTYIINNFTWNTSQCSTFALSGLKGQSIVKRTSASGSQWFNVPAATVHIDGVIFDANSGFVVANQWGVFLSGGGQNIDIEHSVFKNNSGSLGSCLALVSSGPAAGGRFYLNDIEVTNCTFNPLQMGSVAHGIVTGSYIHDNSASGATVNAFGAASSVNYATDISLIGNTFARNTGSGLALGGCAGNTCTVAPFPATYVTVIGNSFQDNTSYQLGLLADHVTVIGNKFTQSSAAVSVFGGIDCNATYPIIEDNDVTFSGSSYGIDCGGATQADIRNNKITIDSGNGIDVGGTINTTVTENTLNLSGTGFGISVLAVEFGGGGAFPNVASNLLVSRNTFNMVGSGTSGYNQYDNAGGYSGSLPMRVLDNVFNVSGSGSGPYQDINYWAAGPAIEIYGNRHNGNSNAFVDPNGSLDVVLDNVFDEVRGFSSTADVRSIVTSYVSTYGAGGSVLYVNPTAGGSGYIPATTVLTLGTCTGAPGAWVGAARIFNGTIIGVYTTNRGSGYGTGCTVTATDSGGGSGATFAVGQTPTLPAFRKLRWISRGNLLRTSGGFVGIAAIPGWMPTGVNQTIDLQATSTGTFWLIVQYANSWLAPTVSSGFGTSPSIPANFGPASFTVNVGTGGAASSGVIALGASHNGWHCTADDVTTPASNSTVQTASSTTTATFTNFVRTTGVAGNWPASDILEVSCAPN